MDYADDCGQEDNYDEHSMTNDEMSDLIGGYESENSSIEGENEVEVIIGDNINSTKEEN